MKKIIVFFAFLFDLVTNKVCADVIDDLKNRLDKTSNFHASFIQKVIDSSGNVIQKGDGNVWVKRPNYFKWHITKPDEILLISDGKTLWFYNPFVEQVTIVWLKDIINNNAFFMLITNNQDRDWQQYDIKQYGNDFILTSKSNSNHPKKLIINISQDGIIHKFSIFKQNNQRIIYQFKLQQNSAIDASKFTFIPPYGVTIDDQRENK